MQPSTDGMPGELDDEDSDSETMKRRQRGKVTEKEHAPLPTDQSLMQSEREKARKRAERFGIDDHESMKEPGEKKALTKDEKLALQAAKRIEILRQRREKEQREGFYTGFDTLTPEEKRKKEERASKYGISLLGISKADAERALKERAEAEVAEEKRKKREGRFGVVERSAKPASDHAEMDVDCLERPVDAPAEAEVRPECVHLYGCDTLTTKDCLGYFRDYLPVFVEWINDSSCNVVFVDSFTAKRAMHGVGSKSASPVPGAVSSDGPVHEDRQWFKGPDFVKNGVVIPLSFRLATVRDVKIGKTNSRYLWLSQPRAVEGGRKRTRRPEPAAELVETAPMELEEGEIIEDAGVRAQRRRRREPEEAVAEPQPTPITGDLRGVIKPSAVVAVAELGRAKAAGRVLQMDVEGAGDSDDGVPDFGNDGP